MNNALNDSLNTYRNYFSDNNCPTNQIAYSLMNIFDNCNDIQNHIDSNISNKSLLMLQLHVFLD